MAIIPLRQYNREIEGLIDTAQLDEAVAHCRHILETFPKHLATYRLLGKAYLEQQRYGDAADIFQRVLSSIPDDHVANIGMSIIREDEGNLDAAIWYMERSLESQPSNAAIKDELRRLYGRRDGIEPPKIRLTRGALARMYARGGLYDQAIGELRAALADDPQRPDLMVLLAQMYFNLGQLVEAVDTCGNLIKKLPYCLVANRILSAILPQTGRAEDTKTYHQRAIAMDPYFATAAANALTADAVPEPAINIERLSYRPGQGTGSSAQPAWAASLGIAFEEKPGDQLPEWLQDQNIPETKPEKDASQLPAAPFSWEIPEKETSEADMPVSAEDIIPDWMKEAGWQPATGTAKEDQVPFTEEIPGEETEDEIAKADLPDWLKNLAPSSVLDGEPAEKVVEPEDVDLPWLQKATPGASDTIVNWLGTQKPAGEATALPADKPVPEIPPAPAEHPTPPVSEKEDNGGLPDWLRGVEASYEKSGITDWLKSSHTEEQEAAPSSSEMPPVPTGEIPDWLKEMGETSEEAEHPAEELPGWLTEMRESEAEFPTIESQLEGAAPPTEEIPGWLQGMGELSEEPAAPAEELPDWLKQMGGPEAEIAEQPATRAEELPAWLKEIEEPGPGPAPLGSTEEEPARVAEEIPDWLREVGQPTAEQAPLETTGEPSLPIEQISELGEEISTPGIIPAPLEPVAGEPTLPADELPDWLQEFGESTAELDLAEPIAEEPALPMEEIPDWIKELGEPITAAALAEPIAEEPALPTEEIPDWIKELGESAVQATLAEPITEEPALPTGDVPDWVKDLGEPTVEATLAESTAVEPVLPIEETPDWLKEIGEPAVETPLVEAAIEEPALSAEEIPAWLKEISESAIEAALAEPTAEEPALPTEEIPDWLTENKQAGVELVAEEASDELELPTGDIPYWMMETTDLSSTEMGILPTEFAGEEQAAPDIELPDWLLELGQPGEIEGAATIEPDGDGEQTPVQEEPDWLKETAQLTPPTIEAIKPFEEEPAQLAEELPDWLKDMGEPTPESPSPFIDQSDQDAALAWLETLAAQHGAKEEELITKPEERLESMPEWIKQEAEDAQAQEATESPARTFDLSDQDSALAWLETLAAKQGADEEELITKPEERLESMPDWIKLEAEESQPEQLPTQPVVAEETVTPTEEIPDWLKQIVAPTDEVIPAQTEPEISPATPEELPDWLAETVVSPEAAQLSQPQAEIEELPDWLQETVASHSEETGDKLAGEIAELPNWLKEAGTPATPPWMPEAILPETELPKTEPLTHIPTMPEEIEVAQPEAQVEPVPSEVLPEILDVNNASLSELERLPGIGFMVAQNIVNYRETNGPFTSLADLGNVPGIEAELLEQLGSQLTTGIPALSEELPVMVETDEMIFIRARQAVEHGEVVTAAQLYNQLVTQKSDMEQVIADMQIALYRYPVDINFWQILGDAYLRTDKLQEALDAYTEAEELLR